MENKLPLEGADTPRGCWFQARIDEEKAEANDPCQHRNRAVSGAVGGFLITCCVCGESRLNKKYEYDWPDE